MFDVCNVDTDLIYQLLLWVYHLMLGVDPWDIWYEITSLISECGRYTST